MRRLVVLVALAVVVLACDNSYAANRRMQARAAPTYSAPAGGGYVANNGYTQPGPLARLIEVERRKNAALRQMFFRR